MRTIYVFNNLYVSTYRRYPEFEDNSLTIKRMWDICLNFVIVFLKIQDP